MPLCEPAEVTRLLKTAPIAACLAKTAGARKALTGGLTELLMKASASNDDEYFGPGNGHPMENTAPYNYNTLSYGAAILGGREVKGLLEMRNGGGFYAEKFEALLGDGFVTVEGSGHGVQATLKRSTPAKQVKNWDLRLPLYLGRRFDLVVCTEVAEHVEPVFSSQIVLNLVLHSDVVWFSSAHDGTHNDAFINHPNERPLKLWESLFDFYGYKIHLLPPWITTLLHSRGHFIAYSASAVEVTPAVRARLEMVAAGQVWDSTTPAPCSGLLTGLRPALVGHRPLKAAGKSGLLVGYWRTNYW
jgi:hypothetical protein